METILFGFGRDIMEQGTRGIQRGQGEGSRPESWVVQTNERELERRDSKADNLAVHGADSAYSIAHLLPQMT